MGARSSRVREFFAEAKKRKVYRVALIYAAGAFAVGEAADLVFPALQAPVWAMTFLVVVVLAGFPVALVLAWVYELQLDRTPAADGEEAHGRPVRLQQALAAVVIVMVSLGMIAAVLRVTSGEAPQSPALASGPNAPDGSRPMIAVLAFVDAGDDASAGHFAFGVHASILTQLSKLSSLQVISRGSVMRYVDTEKTTSEIADELGATAILRGSVLTAGDRVRIAVELIDPLSEEVLWGEDYNRPLENLFAIQSEVAIRVAEALRATLTPAEEERLGRVPTTSMGAYDLYLLGKEAYNEYTPQRNAEAIRQFREAIALDSTFALAWAALSDGYAQSFGFGAPLEWLDSALVSSRKALTLDIGLAEAHGSLGIALTLRGQTAPAMEAFHTAVQLDPSSPAVHSIGIGYTILGEYAESTLWLQRALRLSPANPRAWSSLPAPYVHVWDTDRARELIDQTQQRFGPDYNTLYLESILDFQSGDFDSAAGRADEWLLTHPGDHMGHRLRGMAAYYAHDYERAGEHMRAAIAARPDFGLRFDGITAKRVLGSILMLSGEEVLADALLTEAQLEVDAALADLVLPNLLSVETAVIHAVRGERALALDALRLAYDNGFRNVTRLIADPAWDDFRDDPDFEDIVNRIVSDLADMRLRISRRDMAGAARN